MLLELKTGQTPKLFKISAILGRFGDVFGAGTFFGTLTEHFRVKDSKRGNT